MAAYALLNDSTPRGVNGGFDDSPLTSASTNSNGSDELNHQQIVQVPQPRLPVGKMVRKRIASEMEIEGLDSGGGGGGGGSGGTTAVHPRFCRRTLASDRPFGENKTNVNYCSSSNPSHGGNHSTVVHNLTALTSVVIEGSNLSNPPSGSDATVSSTTSNNNLLDSTLPVLRPQPHHHHLQNPAVCGFSGLPLFPPESNHHHNKLNTRNNPFPLPNPSQVLLHNPPTTATTSIIAAASSPMDDSSATAWIDGIIKDLIHSSTAISIPQLIQNVREIIYPLCRTHLFHTWHPLRHWFPL